MKKYTIGAWLLLALLNLTACMKDSATKSYKVYTPVIKNLSDIRAAIKRTAAVNIGTSGKILLYGNYILVNAPNKGIHIINNSNPASPKNECFISLPGCIDMAISNNILYADCYSDLLALNISNINQIEVVKVLPDHFPDRRSVNGFTVDSSKAIVDWIVKDTIVNMELSDGQGYWRDGSYIGNQMPWPIFQSGAAYSSATTGGVSIAGSMARFAIMNNYLYTVSTRILSCINIMQPATPIVKASFGIGWDIETIYPFKDKLFIGSQTGMSIYDVSNPEMPTYLSGFSHARVCDPVVANDKYAYVTLRSTESNANNSGISLMCWGGTQDELNVVDINDITKAKVVKRINLTHPHGLGIDEKVLIVCDGKAGLKVYDTQKPVDLQLVKTIPMSETYDVICYNNIAIVSALDGIYQFNYSNLNDVRQISKVVYSK